jgi:hypothetical protein
MARHSWDSDFGAQPELEEELHKLVLDLELGLRSLEQVLEVELHNLVLDLELGVHSLERVLAVKPHSLRKILAPAQSPAGAECFAEKCRSWPQGLQWMEVTATAQRMAVHCNGAKVPQAFGSSNGCNDFVLASLWLSELGEELEGGPRVVLVA